MEVDKRFNHPGICTEDEEMLSQERAYIFIYMEGDGFGCVYKRHTSSKKKILFSKELLEFVATMGKCEKDLRTLWRIGKLSTRTTKDRMLKHLRNTIDGNYIHIDGITFDTYTDTCHEGKRVFDMCSVIANPYILGKEKVMDFAKKHKSEIDEIVINAIKNNVKFKKFGIPVNILKLDRITVTCDCLIMYDFVVKEINIPEYLKRKLA